MAPAATPNPSIHTSAPFVFIARPELAVPLATPPALPADVAVGPVVIPPLVAPLLVTLVEPVGVLIDAVPSITFSVALRTFQTSVSSGTVKWCSYPFVCVPIFPVFVISHDALVGKADGLAESV